MPAADLPTAHYGIFVALAAAFAAGAALPLHASERARRGLLCAAVVVGLVLAWQRLSLVDDAFVSLRYADRWLGGKGLTWNDGEVVLGIDNVGWTALLAGVAQVTGLSLPHAALLACAVSWIALIAATERLGASLSSRATLGAPALVAASGATVAFASTGLETAAAAAAVAFAASLLLRADTTARVTMAGVVLAVAGLLRFDHLLFHGLGLLLLPVRWWPAWVGPSLVLEALTAWSLLAYGDPVPNSLLAMGNRGPTDGAMGIGVFWAAIPTLLPLAVWGLRSVPMPLARLAAVFTVGWQFALAVRGGDPTLGRSMLVLVPILAVLAEAAVASNRGLARRIASGLLATALVPLPLVGPRQLRWGLTDAASFYPVVALSPPTVDHPDFRAGTALHALFTVRGLRVTLATWSPGLVGFLSRQEVVDVLGGTDRDIARGAADRPGRGTAATAAYLRARDVHLSRVPPDMAFEDVTRVRTPGLEGAPLRGWHLYRADPAFAETVRLYVPELDLPDGPAWVRARHRGLAAQTPDEARAALRFLDAWWFPWQPQPVVRKAFEERAGE